MRNSQPEETNSVEQMNKAYSVGHFSKIVRRCSLAEAACEESGGGARQSAVLLTTLQNESNIRLGTNSRGGILFLGKRVS